MLNTLKLNSKLIKIITLPFFLLFTHFPYIAFYLMKRKKKGTSYAKIYIYLFFLQKSPEILFVFWTGLHFNLFSWNPAQIYSLKLKCASEDFYSAYGYFMIKTYIFYICDRYSYVRKIFKQIEIFLVAFKMVEKIVNICFMIITES